MEFGWQEFAVVLFCGMFTLAGVALIRADSRWFGGFFLLVTVGLVCMVAWQASEPAEVYAVRLYPNEQVLYQEKGASLHIEPLDDEESNYYELEVLFTDLRVIVRNRIIFSKNYEHLDSFYWNGAMLDSLPWHSFEPNVRKLGGTIGDEISSWAIPVVLYPLKKEENIEPSRLIAYSTADALVKFGVSNAEKVKQLLETHKIMQ